MVNSIETLGLRVESVSPSLYSTSVDVNTVIKIPFNSELNTDTIIGNFAILKDKDLKYKDGAPIVVADYEVLEGLVTYENKTIIFTPSNQLDTNVRYIIYVKKDVVMDILGRALLTDFISYFDTEGEASFGTCKVLEPAENSVLTTLEKIVVEDLGSLNYTVQVSKSKTFDINVFEITFQGTTKVDQFGLGDGTYFIRAKAETGVYGDTIAFTVKTHRGTTPTEQDLDEDYIYAPYDGEELEVVSQYPEPNSIDNVNKTNLFYKKFNKIIPIDDIDFYESQVYGEYTDQDDNFDTDYAKEHGEVDGTFSVVYDEENEETYIFFIPVSM
jgi:hypothetical protein